MKRIGTALWADIRFQYRQGFYLIYLVFTLVYIAVIYQVGDNTAKILVPVLIFFDPSMVGFIFTGGLVVLEKQQGIPAYAGVIPLTTGEYVTAKVLSMLILGIAASLAISVSADISSNLLWLISGVAMTSVFFTLLGLNSAAACKSMNDYFIRMVPYMITAVIPVLGFLDRPWTAVFRIFPTFAGLRLLMTAYGNDFGGKPLADMLILTAWSIAVFIPVKQRFDKKAVRGE